jgi:hypothetical protein
LSDLSKEDFITLVKKSLNLFVPEIKEKGKKYCIHLTDRDVYILLFVFNRPMWAFSSELPIIYIETILPQPPDTRFEDIDIFDVKDDFFLV